VGYRGKVAEQNEARRLRAEGLTMKEIAERLGVSKGSVSLWTRDVPFQPRLIPTRARRRAPNALQRRKQEEIDRLLVDGVARIGCLGRKDFLVAGTALYAGEGAKRDGEVRFTNTDPRLISFFCAWLRYFFDIDESRVQLRLYLHEGLDLEAATLFWLGVTGISPAQVRKPYRAVPDPSIRRAKHPYGCAAVRYGCSRTHREIMGLVHALVASAQLPG
jgi:hypothetical protein